MSYPGSRSEIYSFMVLVLAYSALLLRVLQAVRRNVYFSDIYVVVPPLISEEYTEILRGGVYQKAF